MPTRFQWREEELVVGEVRKTWRTTKVDRGDAYVDRHYYEIALADGRTAVIYFHRRAKRGQKRWWLYTLT